MSKNFKALISRAFGAESAQGEILLHPAHMTLRLVDKKGQGLTCRRGLEALGKVKHYPLYVVQQEKGQPVGSSLDRQVNQRTPSNVVSLSFTPNVGRAEEERYLLEFPDAIAAYEFCKAVGQGSMAFNEDVYADMEPLSDDELQVDIAT